MTDESLNTQPEKTSNHRFPRSLTVYRNFKNKYKELVIWKNSEEIYDLFMDFYKKPSNQDELYEVYWVKSEEEYNDLMDRCLYWLEWSANILYSRLIEFNLTDDKEILRYLSPQKIEKIVLLSASQIDVLGWETIIDMTPEQIQITSTLTVRQIELIWLDYIKKFPPEDILDILGARIQLKKMKIGSKIFENQTPEKIKAILSLEPVDIMKHYNVLKDPLTSADDITSWFFELE